MGICKINYNGKAIIHVDYRDLNEQGMIDQIDEVKKLLLDENVPQLILSEYSRKNYATPKFMRHLEKATQQVLHLVKKSVIVAELNLPKQMILKAYNFFFKRNVKAFDSREEALRYLTDDTRSDYDLPEHLRR